jgi:hypothetical protein
MIVGRHSRPPFRGLAQFGSASALGAEGRRFKSCISDINKFNKRAILITRIKTMNALERFQGTHQQESTEASGVQEDSAVQEVWAE